MKQTLLELKINRAIQTSNAIISVIELFDIPYFKWFLFGNKPTISINAKTREEALLTETLFYVVSRYILQKEVYSHILEMSKESSSTLKSSGYKIFFSKNKIKKDLNKLVGKKDIAVNFGKIYGYPKCCIDAYRKDSNDTGSFESVVRYRSQCKKLNVQDKFFVTLANKENVGFVQLFVPCSPKCSEALKILKQYTEIQEAIKKVTGRIR